MNQIVRTSGNGPPAPSREIAALQNLVCWTPSDPTQPLELTRSLTSGERAAVEARAGAIRDALARRDQTSVDRALNAMMLAFPAARAAGSDADAIASSYVYVLGDLPSWAVTDVIRQYMRGQIRNHNPAFPPSAAEIHGEAERITAVHKAELHKLERLLDATVPERPKPISPERQRVIEDQRVKVDATESLRAMLRDLGKSDEEIEAALSETPDAPERTGTFRRPREAA